MSREKVQPLKMKRAYGDLATKASLCDLERDFSFPALLFIGDLYAVQRSVLPSRVAEYAGLKTIPPPVTVVFLNGLLVLRDGHHRVAATRSRGREVIEARIYVPLPERGPQ